MHDPLKAGKSCIIDVTFKADAEGTLTATLNLMDNAVGMPQHVGLTGNVIDPVAQFSPTKLSFGTQAVHSSKTLPVQLTNSGQTPLDISNISIGGTDAGDFSQTNNCPAILAAAASCTISVTFDSDGEGSAHRHVDRHRQCGGRTEHGRADGDGPLKTMLEGSSYEICVGKDLSRLL